MARKTLTDAEREQRRADDRALIQSAVDELRSSAGWQKWLTTRSRFGSYSLRNQLLIALQRPDATRVAGFRAWLDLGYCVRKGETGIRIFAPMPPSKKQLQEWRDAGADPADKPRPRFRLTAVFDRAQVDELPPPAEPAPLEPPTAPEIAGDELAPWLAPLQDLARQIGSTVSYEPVSGSRDGFYSLRDRRIVVEVTHPANRQVKTLMHELAHALVRADRKPDDPELDTAGEEVVAETVAFCVCRGAGLADPGDYSVAYLAGWAERTAAEPEELAALIDRFSRQIEDRVADIELAMPTNGQGQK